MEIEKANLYVACRSLEAMWCAVTGCFKVGTLIPVRIFVRAGLPAETTYFLFGEFDSGSERTLAA